MGCQWSDAAAAAGSTDNQGLLGSESGQQYNMKSAVPKSSSKTKGGGGGGGGEKEKAPPPKNKAAKPKAQPLPPLSPQKPHAPVKQLPSTANPINRAIDRVSAIDKSKQITVGSGNIKMTYAYLSQRGFYPDDPFKANQDAYCVQTELTSEDKQDAIFGVFDGHGRDGDGCAIYAKQNLPVHVRNLLNKTPPNEHRRSSHGGNSSSASNLLKNEAPCHSREQVHSAISRAHTDVNRALHKNPNIDDSLSGTTAISIYFHGRRNRITVANVGDSRAVIGQASHHQTQLNGGNDDNNNRFANLKAVPLSRDQTPYRKDEKVRVRAAGARVLSLDQLEGLEPIIEGASENNEEEMELGEELDEGGDPPRVWAQNGDYPGTAFTRSIGDSVAEDLGVFAEPELLTREITPEDKILVLASDGVFEFLTNQSVIDICAKFSDPLEACRAVVAEAYELWLQYELRTDDITIICFFLDEVKGTIRRSSLGGSSVASSEQIGQGSAYAPDSPKKKSSLVTNQEGDDGEESSDDDVDEAPLTTEGLRPVRKHASKEKSKAIAKWKELGKTLHIDETDDSKFNWKDHATDKTETEKRSIADAIRASVMFRNTNDEQRGMIYACMESVPVKAGTWVIRQGTVGDRFYIVDEGQFEVRIVPDGEDDETGQGGHIVHIYEGSREKHAHPSFGELALVHSMPRSASVVAKSDGHLWALHRAAFRQVLVQAQDHRKELKQVLGEIPYFQFLDSDAINKLATIMDEVTFGRGENITDQGRKGESMYVISSGSCYGVEVVEGGTKRSTLKAGSHFGDEIFAKDAAGAYSTTVVALQTCVCWQLDHGVMKQTMGPLLEHGG